MPFNPKVLQLTQSEIGADLARLHREHLEELCKIAEDPKRRGPHMRSGTHGRAILDEICKTYRQRAEAIHDVLVRSLRFQNGQEFTADELAHAFEQFFEPERSKVLEHSRQRLAEIRYGSFINDTVTEANRLLGWFRTKAEHIAADQQPRAAATPLSEPPKEITGSGALVTAEVKMAAYGRADSRVELDRAAEVTRELERLHSVLPAITDRELSAYSTKSLSIGTFLHHKGHAFSVLTEDMLAEQFREEFDRRKAARLEGWRSTLTSPATFTAIVGAIVAVLTLMIATCSGGTN